MTVIDGLLAKDLVPDAILRIGIRRLLRQRLRDETRAAAGEDEALARVIDVMRRSPVAVQTRAANEQHYEVPTRFFQYCLGPRMKYSSGLWNGIGGDLAEAEEAMLRLSCDRAELLDGQRILELGCGWGSLTLWMAEHYPQAKVVGVSNSRTQKEFIDNRARELGLKNVRIITADMNTFEADESFDRVVSVEMFEHMRNWETLLERISRWLVPEGKFFMHIFTHRSLAYFFENKDPSDWMSRYFFTGGIMPSGDLLHKFDRHMRVESDWQVNGTNYARTAEAWLENMDRHKEAILPILAQTYGEGETTKWWVYWRVFYMACAELWGFKEGQEWMVSHYLMQRREREEESQQP